MAKVTYTGGRNPKGLNKIDKMTKVTNTGGRKPKELNKIDKMAKVTNTGGRNGLNKIDKWLRSPIPEGENQRGSTR